MDEDAIFPCVDIGVGDLLDDGTPLVVATVAGYPPQPFGENWTGRDGPFVRIVGDPFMAKTSGLHYPKTKVFRYSVPDTESKK